MLRISTTTVDTYRWYAEHPEIPGAEQKLIDSIMGKFKPTKQMELGTAFHAILADPFKYYDDALIAFCYNGIIFPYDTIAQAYEYIDYDYPFEVKHEMEYTVSGEPVIIVAKVDQLEALKINELKTRWTAFNIDSYVQSLQWKLYLDVFQARMVEYFVFCLKPTRDGDIILKSTERFTVSPYPGMKDYINDMLTMFVDFVYYKGLESYLEPKPVYTTISTNTGAKTL